MVEIYKLVGAATDKSWPQVHVFFPEKKKSLGVMMAAVLVKPKQEEIDLAQFGSEVILRIHEKYYGEGGVRGLKRLVGALEAVAGEFGDRVDLTAAVGIVAKDNDGKKILYAALVGGARVAVWRERKLIILLKGDGLGPLGRVAGVSGFLQASDRLVLATEGLFAVEVEDKLLKALERNCVEEAGDSLAPKIHSGDSSMVSAVLADLSKKKAREVVEINRLEEDGGFGETDEIGRGSKTRLAVLRLMARLWINIGKLRLRQGKGSGIYAATSGEKRKKLTGSVIVVMAVLLLVSVGFGIVRQRNSTEAVAFKEVKEEVARKVGESEQLETLNILRSRALLVEAQEEIKRYMEAGVSKKAKGWVEETDRNLKQRLEELLKIYSVEPEVFLDLNLVREESVGAEMDFDGEGLLVLDKLNDVLLSVEMGSKKAAVVGGGQLLNGSETAAVYFGRGFVVSNSGVVELDLKRKTSAVVVDRDDNWGEIAVMNVFGGNLYLLDRKKGEIYRYRGVKGGFGEMQRWLGAGVEPDFSKVVSMAIDGSIWILTSTGNLEKYSQGTGVAVEIVGIDKELSEPEVIYTDDEALRLYILDKGNDRVVVLDKEGRYEAQYKWEGIEGVVDMVVSEKEGKILLLSSSKIYEIPLLKQ